MDELQAGDSARRELVAVFREVRSLLARPENDFCWSSWEDAEAALREVDGLIDALEVGRLPSLHPVSFLFAPTGPIQEVSLSSGWGDESSALADRCDAAVSLALDASYKKPHPGDGSHATASATEERR